MMMMMAVAMIVFVSDLVSCLEKARVQASVRHHGKHQWQRGGEKVEEEEQQQQRWQVRRGVQFRGKQKKGESERV